MRAVFNEVNSLDKRCYSDFYLSEDILMENASQSVANFIKSKFQKAKILIVAGVGNNGADGIALARILHLDFEVELYLLNEPKSEIGKLQLKRAKAIGVKFVDSISNVDIVVDSIFGSGLSRKLSSDIIEVIKKLNALNSFKIACDIPSGIDKNGNIQKIAFKSDVTITMGALKTSLFLDEVKDFVGEIFVADLGISNRIYEINSDIWLLEESDLKLPFREIQNTHKGNFGHLALFGGDKIGASIISSLSALNFGSGLVTLITQERESIPFEIMQSQELPKNTTAIAIGMGFGENFNRVKDILIDSKVPLLLDADIFYSEVVLDILDRVENIVLTPHPKEFQSLLKLTKIADTTINEIQKNRFKYILEFSTKYPNCVILLKGSNTLIAHNKKIYINSLGSSALSKGGSGDVLAGLIASELSRANTPIKSAINGSLTHSLLVKKIDKNNYSITPKDLIEAIGKL